MAGVRGLVAGGGGISAGAGFALERTGPGAYTIGFTQRYADPPVVVVTPTVAGSVAAVASSTAGADVTITNLQAVPVDTSFGFIVEPIGGPP
jgi:hypothetical protein